MYYITKEEWKKIEEEHPHYTCKANKRYEHDGKVCEKGENCCFEYLMPGAPNTGTTLIFEHIHFEIVDKLPEEVLEASTDEEKPVKRFTRGDIVSKDTYDRLTIGDVIRDVDLNVTWEVVEGEGEWPKLSALAGKGSGPFITADPKTTNMVFVVLSSGEVA